jgi:cytochrome P450
MQQFPANTALSIYYTAIAQKYNLKGIFYMDLWPFGPPQMILVSPDAADLVTKVQDYPLHEMGISYLAGLVGENAMGATNGDKWKGTHRLLAPAFRTSSVKAMAGVVADQTVELFTPFLERCADEDGVFSMETAAAKLLLSISTVTILGGDIAEDAKVQLFEDIGDIVAYATMITLTTSTNPVTKWRTWWKKTKAVKRLDMFFEGLVRAREEVTRGVGKDAAGLSILDRTLIEGRGGYWNNGPLDPAATRLLVDK